MKNGLLAEIKNHWRQLREMTYDLLLELKEDDLTKRLPFPESQDIAYQFYCLIGAQESNIPLIVEGRWKGFSCSLDKEREVTRKVIKQHLHKADKKLFKALDSVNLLYKFKDGSTPLSHYLVLVEHESHHQGQLINFIYSGNLPIPKSWREKWALTRDV